MSLRAEHEKNVGRQWQPDKFGWQIKLQSPDGSHSQGFDVPLYGQYHRVGVMYDPETNLPVNSDFSSIGLRLSDLTVSPVRGWKIFLTDITGEELEGIVEDRGNKDRTIGFVTIPIRIKT